MVTRRLGRMFLPPAITSRTNSRVKALRGAFSGKASRPGELVGIEGLKSLEEASSAGLRFDTVALAESAARSAESRIARWKPRELLVLSEEVMASLGNTVTASQVLATVQIPEEGRPGPKSGLFLLLEEIQDPGNLGTLIRSAEAFGAEELYLSPGCANAWSPKVIRSSAGSVFRQPITRLPVMAAVAKLRREGVRLAGAVVRREGAKVSLRANLKGPVALLIGNEGAGLSAEALACVDETVYIPCRTESLNAAVAGSVLLYEALSQNPRSLSAAKETTAPSPLGAREHHGAV